MKKLIAVICAIICVLSLCACNYTEPEKQINSNNSMFALIEKSYSYSIIYHKETKVMYAVSNNRTDGIFTVLLNADGTPMTYDN